MDSTEKISVLIVDDIAETRETIRKLLQFEGDVEVIGVAQTGREGIDMSKESKPDVIIMDINMPDMDGINATELIRKISPFSQIIILSVQADQNYMRRAMMAGARDYLTKPPAVDELISAVKRAGKMALDEKEKASQQVQPFANGHTLASSRITSGKILSVFSPKGGTGCTTLAVNLGISLHQEDLPVIIVDGKMQFGDVAVLLNEQGKNSIADLTPRADELELDIIEDVTVKHAASGIRILCAPNRLELAEGITGNQFVKVLLYLKKIFSYVVVDLSSTLTDIALSVFDISDVILLLTSQDIPSIKNSRLCLDLFDTLSINHQRLLFIMNRYDKRIGITPEKISETFKHEIVSVIPLDEHLVVPSVNRGVPFMLGDKSRVIAKAYVSLAGVIRQRLSELSESEEINVPATGTSRLFGR